MNRYGRIPVSAASGLLGKRALQVYIAISGRCVRGSFVSFASLSQIASDTGIDRWSLDRPIGECERAGFLRAERHQGRKTQYTILFPSQLSAAEPTVNVKETVATVGSATDSESARQPTVLSARQPTHTESLQKTYRRARETAPPNGRRSRAEQRGALMDRLHQEAYRDHGTWRPEWGEPPSQAAA